MSKMTLEVDEEELVKGKYDGLGTVCVEVGYVKDLISTCRRLTLRNMELMYDLAEVTTERDKLLKALGDGGKDDMCVVVDFSDFFDGFQKRKSV